MDQSIAYPLGQFGENYLAECKNHVTTQVILALAFITGGVNIGLSFIAVIWVLCGIASAVRVVFDIRRIRKFEKTLDAYWKSLDVGEKN